MLETRLRSFGDNTGGTSGSGSGGTTFTIPLIMSSGGTGITKAGSATMLIGMNSSSAEYDFYNLIASDNATIVRSGTAYFISANTGTGGSSTSTAGLVQSSFTISTVYPISGGGNLSLNRTFAVDTAFLLTASNITLARTGASTYSTVQHLMDFSLSSGRATGGSITASATANLVDVSAGTGFIKALDSNNTTQTFFNWSASAAILVGAGSTRYIGVQYNAGNPNIVLKTTDTWDLDTDFPLGIVVNEGGTRYIANIPWQTGDNIANLIERFDSIGFKRDERVGGLILSNTGTRNVAVSAGTILARMEEIAVSAIDTSGANTFDGYYRDGSGGWTKESGSTQWNNTKYDDGTGTLATLTVLNYTSRWFYVMADGSLAMVYGQAQYSTLAGALNDGTPSSVPDRILKGGILIGRFIIQNAGTAPSVTQSAFGTSFTAASVTNFSDLAGTATVPQGGTSTTSFTSGGILYGGGTAAIQAMAALNSGTLIVGSSTLVSPQPLTVSAGSQGYMLIINSASKLALSWAPSSGAGASTVYAATGNTYIVTDLASDLTNEFRLVQSGNSITINTAGNLIVINAVTGGGVVTAGSAGNLAYYPSAGATVDDLLIGSAMTIVGVNSSAASHQYFVIQASNNATVTYSGTSIFISATTASATATQSWVLPGFSSNANGTFVYASSQNLGVGISTIYITPNGRRAMLISRKDYNPSSTVSVGFGYQIVVSGNTYVLASVATKSPGQNSTNVGPMIILNSGDQFRVFANSAGENVFFEVYEFDTSDKVYSSFVNPGSGNNTVYTCPNAVKSMVLRSQAPNINFLGQVVFSNSTQTTRNITTHWVRSGNAISTVYQLGTTDTVSANNTSSLSGTDFTGPMTAGDIINIFLDSGAGMQTAVWANVTEI